MDWIKQIVEGMIEFYETRDIYELLERLEIVLIKKKLASGEKGRFLRNVFNDEYIYVSETLSEYEEKMIIAHELGHLILHTDLSTSYYTENHLLNKDQIEVQANKFAAELLIPDDIKISEGITTKELACYLEVSEELVKLKYKDVI